MSPSSPPGSDDQPGFSLQSPDSPPIRYVAIGDSFTEGVGDDGTGTGTGTGTGAPAPFPGWAGRLATGLAASGDRPVFYANLAIRGRLLGGVLDEQLPAALALQPPATLVTFCAGGNDMLRPRFDTAALLARVETAATAIRATGAQLVLLSPADPSSRIPLGRLVRSRGIAWAELLGSFAQGSGIPFVDVSLDPYLHEADFWASDRLHMNAAGHQRVADLALEAIADAPPPLAPVLDPAGRARLGSDLRYYREHVAPWVKRRLTRRSTGDGRAAPYPVWTRV
ncbi:SGNH/GDSL hydrolase family protein [Herbiconiux sp. P18]|uniref:SGNH/GDSL hydrolase family protein n=1 Tax=Herbiconiux liangxiaofengii TaxID=3342795 RepID=UPI0035BA1F24